MKVIIDSPEKICGIAKHCIQLHRVGELSEADPRLRTSIPNTTINRY